MNAAQFFDHWNKVWRDLLQAIGLLEDKHLSIKPAETHSRTVVISCVISPIRNKVGFIMSFVDPFLIGFLKIRT